MRKIVPFRECCLPSVQALFPLLQVPGQQLPGAAVAGLRFQLDDGRPERQFRSQRCGQQPQRLLHPSASYIPAPLTSQRLLHTPQRLLQPQRLPLMGGGA